MRKRKNEKKGLLGLLQLGTYYVIQGNRSIVCTENFCSKTRHEFLKVSIKFTCIKQVKEIISIAFSFSVTFFS